MDAEVEPAADLEILVEREDQAYWGAEELVVAAALLLGAFEVALGDAEQAVEVPADLAPAREEGLAPLDRVVVPFALVDRLAVAIEGRKDGGAQPVATPPTTRTSRAGCSIRSAAGGRASSSSTLARGTGVGRKERTARRVRIASCG
jgi:hypothetical protein